MPLSLKQVDRIHTPDRFFLPRMAPYPAWAASTSYVVGDKISEGDYEYIALEDHTSSALWGDDVLLWQRYGHIPYTDEELVDHPVYDYPHQEETYTEGKGLRRRAKPKADAPDTPVDQTANARLFKITGKQHFFVDGYYDGDPIYTWELIPEYWDGNSWEFQELDGVVDIDNEAGVMTCIGTQGFFEWDIQIGFTADNSKWSIDITAPGFTVRVRQEIVFTALGQQMVADGDLVLDYSDFVGNTSDDEGVVTRNVIYEPDGVDATSGWVVDPYLTVDEQATYIDVFCDGYVFRANFGGYGGNSIDIRNSSNSAVLFTFNSRLGVGASSYRLYYDEDRECRVVDKSNLVGPVILHMYGGLDSAGSGTTYLPNTTYPHINLWFYIYPDNFVADVILVTDDTNTITNSLNYNMFFGVASDLNWNVTSPQGIYENAGSESTGTSTTQNSADYIGFRADEANLTGSVLYENHQGAVSFAQYLYWHRPKFDLDNGDLDTGTHRLVTKWHIDSADRENDGGTFLDWDTDIDTNAVAVGDICTQSTDGLRYYCHTAHTAGAGNEPPDTDYWWEYRMTLGDAAKDLVMDAPTTGSEVTDLVIPLDLSSDGFASDGARHLEEDTGVIEYTADITRIGHVDVIHDSPFNYGGSDKLLVYWDCDSTTLNTGTGSVTVTNATYSSGVRGNGVLIDAADEVAYIQSSGNVPSAAGTFIFNVIGNDGSGTANARFFQQETATDRLELFWTNATTIGANINGTSITFTVAIDPLDGNEHTVKFGFDTTYEYSYIEIDGQVQDVDRTAITAPTVSSDNFYIGNAADGDEPIEAIIDEFKIINGCIVPNSALYTGNGSVDSTAHEDITFYDAMDSVSNGHSPGIGTGTVTVTGSPTLTTGIYGSDTGVQFDADGEYFSISEDNFDFENCAISFWYKSIGGDPNYATFFSYDFSGGDDFYVMRTNIANEVFLVYGSSQPNIAITDIWDNEWHHIKYTHYHDGTDINRTFWVDGVKEIDRSDTITKPTKQAVSFIIGATGAANVADGIISDFYITSDPNTPQISTMLGVGPRYMPRQTIE